MCMNSYTYVTERLPEQIRTKPNLNSVRKIRTSSFNYTFAGGISHLLHQNFLLFGRYFGFVSTRCFPLCLLLCALIVLQTFSALLSKSSHVYFKPDRKYLPGWYSKGIHRPDLTRFARFPYGRQPVDHLTRCLLSFPVFFLKTFAEEWNSMLIQKLSILLNIPSNCCWIISCFTF